MTLTKLPKISPSHMYGLARRSVKENSHLSTYDEFKTLYLTKLEKTLIQRLQEIKPINIGWFVFIFLFAFPYILLRLYYAIYSLTPEQILGFPRDLTDVIFFIIVFPLIAYLLRKHDRFTKIYKETVIEPIIKFINPNLQYFPNKHISAKDYLDSRLFKMDKTFEGDDYIEGVLDNFEFKMSELHTAYESKHPIFDGLFFVFKYQKNINSKTCIYPDRAQRLIGKLLAQKIQSFLGSRDNENLVKLENPEFEKLFKVFSTDQIEARTILTPVMMEKIIKFQNDLGAVKLYISFINNSVYIGLKSATHKQFFEPPSLIPRSKIAIFNFAQDIYNCINTPIEIAKEINNNASVWKK